MACSYAIIVVAIFSPYCVEVSVDRINASSVFKDNGDVACYETKMMAWEHGGGLISIAAVLLATLILFFVNQKWRKALLIVLGIIYFPLMFLKMIGISFSSGALPFGGSTLSGFFLLWFSVLLLLVIASLKPAEGDRGETSTQN